jgi:hypothetical protein
MADTAVTTTNVIKLVKDTATAAPAGQAVTTGNVAVLTPQAGQELFTGASSVGGQFTGRYLLIKMVESGSVATSVVTPQAGVTGGTPANLAALGNGTAITFSSGQTKYIRLELARYLQANDTVRLAVSGVAGSVTFSVIQLDSDV